MAYVLGIETSSPRGSLALFSDSDRSLIAYREWTRGKSHSELVTPTLCALLSDAHADLNELRAVAVGIGPGSFTGIRVGINVARTLGYCFSIPVFCPDSLQILAMQGSGSSRPIVCLVNAFRNMIYLAAYSESSGALNELISPQAVRPDEIPGLIPANALILGDAYSIYQDIWPADVKRNWEISTIVYPSAREFPRFLAGTESGSAQKPWNQVKPLYIRASEAEEKLRSGALKPPPKF